MLENIDIEFEDLSYSIKTNQGTKKILSSINGKFCCGDLTAILGPSGAGKTTLLNILANYVSFGVTGTIRINDKLRDTTSFNKICTYITQEDLLQPLLTVKELMQSTARLKLGSGYDRHKTPKLIENILDILKLNNCTETRTERLSGGEKKRLSIALELIGDPPVLFLDEPTTGLDSVANRQCIDVLQILAHQGKTIICTIHQPSPTIFNQFDSVYFIADGMCIYNGIPTNIIQFLNDVDLPCPITYSPEEYAIEMSQTNQECVSRLVAASENGKATQSIKLTPCLLRKPNETRQASKKISKASFFTQFFVLLHRMMLQHIRNKHGILIQFLHHFCSACLIGLLFFNGGKSSELAMSNIALCGIIMIFFVYTYVSQFVLLFPTELKILKKEYYNRWYNLNAYFMALSLRNIPIMVILGTLFITICYVLTGQPMDLGRYLSFVFIGILVGITSEGLGIAIGSIFNVKQGSIIFPAVVAAFLGLSIFAIGEGTNISLIPKIMVQFSYLRYALVALCLAIYENREPLECNDIYCHLSDPKVLLKYIGMVDAKYTINMIGLCVFLILFRLIAYLALKFKLTREFSSPLINSIVSYVRIKIKTK